MLPIAPKMPLAAPEMPWHELSGRRARESSAPRDFASYGALMSRYHISTTYGPPLGFFRPAV